MEDFKKLSTEDLRHAAQLAIVNLKSVKPEFRDELLERYTAIIIELNSRIYNYTFSGFSR